MSSQGEEALILLAVVVLGVLIDTQYTEGVTPAVDDRIGEDLIACQVVVADQSLSGLLHLEGVRQPLPTEKFVERIITVVLLVDLQYFNSVIG